MSVVSSTHSSRRSGKPSSTGSGIPVPVIHDSDMQPTASSRQRQSKKDEAIRKKIEQELKKRGGATRIRQTKKIAGTVSALRPAQALTVRQTILVIEAAQLMAAKRSDCVLVVDEEEHLCGIFTAKDLAYRVVADNLDSRAIMVSHIMTKDPMCVTADTSAQDALNLMVSRGFRHLPVCNEEGDIFGLLDITKCLYEALNKMERAYGSSRKLYDALEGVEREWANSPVQFVQYMEALRDKMSCPDLTTVLDHAGPVQVTVKANVREVAKLMKEYHTTAVLVMDHGGLAGIFTSKDIVLRVIAAGLAPENCSVVRVMTPHPDTATPTTSTLDALKKMHDGHYLNLPVLDEDKTVIGLVDVLRLTYATLEQINSIEGNGTDGGKFWNNIAAGDHETDSAISDSLSQAANSHMFRSPSLTPQPDQYSTSMPGHAPTYTGLGYPDITPGDSASVANDDAQSAVSSHVTGTFAFKFNYGNKAHRFRCDYSNYEALKDIVRQKIMNEHLSLSQSYVKIPAEPENEWLTIAYLDDEDDQVLMTCDADLADSVQLARKLGQDRVRLFVHDALAEAMEESKTEEVTTVEPPASEPTTLSNDTQATLVKEFVPQEAETVSEISSEGHKKHRRSPLRRRRHRGDSESESDTSTEDEEDTLERRRSRRVPKKDIAAEYGLPVPSELLLPAAITFLGVVILGVFTITKLTGPSGRY
ncbi:hypothetical protein EC973_000162 [Apophysomyces ossiformis]|uniref:CBS-domain-containing protein n=1 Tax=Apophysomyces ossiformis TaxID=679940 RepID=A0A8H7BWI9_9FUNG|nr:hypothetical protein EC973_000162 [Apophysomyces ossiformis]